MPRNVRNFWLTLSVDGRASRVQAGPQSKDGGFELRVQMRDAGGIAEAGTLKGYAESDGTLRLTWHANTAWGVPSEINTPRTILAESHRSMIMEVTP